MPVSGARPASSLHFIEEHGFWLRARAQQLPKVFLVNYLDALNHTFTQGFFGDLENTFLQLWGIELRPIDLGLGQPLLHGCKQLFTKTR